MHSAGNADVHLLDLVGRSHETRTAASANDSVFSKYALSLELFALSHSC